MSHGNGSSTFVFQVMGILKPVTVSTDKGLQLSHSPMVGCNSLDGSNFDFRMTYLASQHPGGMVLYNTVLYCMLLYNIVLYGTVQYCIVFIILYCMVLYYIICYCTVLYFMILYSTVLYGALQ